MTALPLFLAMILMLFGKHAAAATVAGTAAAGAVAFELGADPWPWILGGMACTVVYAYKPPDNRAKALANAVMCIFLGGVFAPWFAGLDWVAPCVGTGAGKYVLCFLIPATWPWTAPVLYERFRQLAAVFSFTKGPKNDA